MSELSESHSAGGSDRHTGSGLLHFLQQLWGTVLGSSWTGLWYHSLYFTYEVSK